MTAQDLRWSPSWCDLLCGTGTRRALWTPEWDRSTRWSGRNALMHLKVPPWEQHQQQTRTSMTIGAFQRREPASVPASSTMEVVFSRVRLFLGGVGLWLRHAKSTWGIPTQRTCDFFYWGRIQTLLFPFSLTFQGSLACFSTFSPITPELLSHIRLFQFRSTEKCLPLCLLLDSVQLCQLQCVAAVC